MKNILTIMKKELVRVLKDRALLLGMILPGLFIFFIYSFIGGTIQDSATESENATYKIVAINMPVEIRQIMESDELDLNADISELSLTSDEIADYVEDNEQAIRSGTLDVILVFSPDFVAEAVGGNKPKVEIYYNPYGSTSILAFNKATLALSVYNDILQYSLFGDITVFTQTQHQFFDEDSVMAEVMAMLLPMLLISFLFTGCMSMAVDSIAGEKERGTIATVLVTPIKRSELALGKVFSLSILAAISATSSFLGVILSLPKLMGGAEVGALYGFSEFALLFGVLVSTILLIIGVMSIVSSFAKTTKEASMFILPFMLVSTIIGLASFMGSGAASGFAFYFLPIYSSVQSMISILTFDVNIVNLLICFFSNIVYAAACVFGLTKLFNSERVMFNK